MFWQGHTQGIEIAARRIALVVAALLPIVSADLSYAAGRVFYDGFESGNTNLWGQDGSYARCKVATAPVDGVAGPYAGSRMLSCNWNGAISWDNPLSYETLMLSLNSLGSYNSEVFLRVRLRADQNLDRTTGASAKILRWYDPPMDIIANVDACPGVNGGWGDVGYWGCAAGDNTATSSSWHKVEYYFNQATGNVKQWNDGLLVVNGFASFPAKLNRFYPTSNFSNPHDAANNIYFDEIEIFTDKASGASGSMSDASVSASTTPAPAPPSDVSVR